MSSLTQSDLLALDTAIAARWHSPEHDARHRRSRRRRGRMPVEDPDDMRARWFKRYLESRDAPKRKRRGDPNWELPKFSSREEAFRFAAEWGATESQQRQAWSLDSHGLGKKARNVALCGTLARRVRCLECGKQFLRRFRCRTRYCPQCGEKIGRDLYAKWAEILDPVADSVRAFNDRRGVETVVAKLDLTAGSRNPLRQGGRMPTPAEVKRFNRDVWRLRRALERRYGLTRKSFLMLGMDEVGGSNNNLHRHMVYVGPWLPQRRKELTRLWSEIRGETAFASIKRAASVSAALTHALHYPLKFLSRSEPERLAALERMFHGARRFFVAGALYRARPPQREPGADESLDGGCPECGGQLVEPALGFGGGWVVVRNLEREGAVDLDVVRQSAKVRFAHFQRRVAIALTDSGSP